MQNIVLVPEQLAEYLDALIQWEAVEVSVKDDLVRIPYMMNDAIECYLELTGCVVQGQWEPDNRGKVELTMQEGTTRKGFSLRQGDAESENSNVVTIWYEEVHLECHPYQYHTIGHLWRSTKGQEAWRRLVHLLCVIHDKVNYLGDDVLMDACNAEEESLAPLIEFGPITFLSPIDRSIESWYLETEEGYDAMEDLAREAGDRSYASMVETYRLSSQKKRRRMREEMAMKLCEKEHEAIYQLLLKKITQASQKWPEREYPPELTQSMEEAREAKVQELLSQGCLGQYPRFAKRDKGAIRRILLVEELPFTVLEWEDYSFRINEIEE